ncbi:MAG TPA: replicative DNA helicase [Ignavibacteriales bacterium]|jgi:replicative DNA helicase|nr:replicative DNA helicase [Ignavibacteriales bacterium]
MAKKIANKIEINSLSLPSDENIEMNVIGTMLYDNDCIPQVIEILPPDAFTNSLFRKCYEIIIDSFEHNRKVDLITITDRLSQDEKFAKNIDEIKSLLLDITTNLIASINVTEHSKILQDKYIRRKLINTGIEIAKETQNWQGEVDDLLDLAEHKIFEIAEEKMKTSYQDMKSAISDAYQYIETVHTHQEQSFSVKTGLNKLDDLTGGFHKSDLIIVAARPSMGKTAFALTIAKNAALRYKVPVAFFSLEMSTLQLALRLICAEAKINAHQLRTGKLPSNEITKLSKTIYKLSEAPIYIDDSPLQTVLDIRAKVRRLVSEKKVGLVMVDYLQLIKSTGSSKEVSREREVSIISSSLKALAKEANIPVVALAQLNRSVEQRSDKIPQLSDLRESGSIEQDADLVIFLHRPEYYGIKQTKEGESTEGVAQVIVAKHRNGPTDTVNTRFFKEYALFENLINAVSIEENYQPNNQDPGF